MAEVALSKGLERYAGEEPMPTEEVGMGSPRLIYDGECGICRAMVERLPWFDPEGRWEALPYQSLGEAGLRELGLTPAECARAVQVVTGQGRIFAGPWAVNYLLWERWPGRILVTILFMLPPLLLLEWIGYRFVERYRSRLSGWLGLTACAVSPPPALTPAEPKERGQGSPSPLRFDTR